ncbi:MAG: hypothetical protein EOM87_07055, partial [Clostridia bacterium]|nr:hypothetical protein [Clostridia bacterium]
MKKILIAILLLIPLIVLLSINVSGLIISAEISISIENITLTHQGNMVTSQQILLEDYIKTNKSYKLFADYYPRIAQNRAIIWHSTDENVATVKNGVVTFHDYGSVDITATAASYTSISATCTFYVIGEEIQRIAVSEFGENSSKTEYYMKKYEVLPLKVSVIPSTALSNKKLAWTSNNTDVVDVDSNGVITAKNIGTASITVSADGKSGKKVTQVLTIVVDGQMLAKADTVYTTQSLYDLSPLLNYSGISLYIGNNKQNDTTIDIGNSEETIIRLTNENITEYITIIKKQTTSALVFENIKALQRGIWQDDNYIMQGGSDTILKAIAAEGALPNNPSIIWQSNNLEVATVVDGRIYGHIPGTAVITASLDGYESAEIEVKVATAISYIRLKLDKNGDKLGLAEERFFGIYTCTDKVVTDTLPIEISSSYPNVLDTPDYQRLFYYYSSNEDYATVDEDGIITFKKAGANKDVTITVAAKYSNLNAKDSYTFHLVDGINIGYGYEQNLYDEKLEKMPSYAPFDDLIYIANDYKDDY